MHIRTAKPEDARAIAGFIAMAESEMVEFFTGTRDPEKGVEAMLAFVVSPARNRYSLANNLVAEIDGQPAGSLIRFPADQQPELDKPILEAVRRLGHDLDALFFEGEPGTYYLSTMGVDPAFRGQGIGSGLLAAAEEEAARRGFNRVSLLVSKDKPRVQGLYERVGFTAIKEVRIGPHPYNRMVKAVR